MRIFLIIIVFFIHGEAFAKEFKWKFKERINHDNYYESIGTGVKKVKIDGKNKRIKFKITEYYPLSTELNEKEGRCKDFRIQEISTEDIILEKSYSLNDCLPCIDKGAGYMCSYPYFEVFYRYDKYGIYDSNFDFLSRFKDVTEDGAKQVIFFINIGSREKVMFNETYPGAEGLGLGDLRFFSSQIFKYNTRLRKIRSERSKVKKTQSPVFELVFNRIKDNTLNNIENKTKLNIRDKDIKILFTAEPSLSVTKFQTRD
ncbi:hypothetical protein N8842_00270 [Candidatus Pelagibacter sp.]|nr:hypothetical protein [Candidatus Pelagibacter sp.]MDC0578174.1 hypothetical protein [Candidatus Pelagibacter ubique]MDC1483111.1 hypothetical protein [Pelagibacteraceae bacterium]